jgi:hypothetical protein
MNKYAALLCSALFALLCFSLLYEYALLIWRRDLSEVGEVALIAVALKHVVAGIAQEVVAGFAGLAAHLLRQYLYACTSKASRLRIYLSSLPRLAH